MMLLNKLTQGRWGCPAFQIFQEVSQFWSLLAWRKKARILHLPIVNH
jgi:hypothetical protein